MAIVRYPPNTIHLGGQATIVNTVPAGVAILPGHLIDLYSKAGVLSYRPHATASIACEPTFALNQSMLNKGCDDTYAINDLVEAAVGVTGSTFWARLATGQNIAVGAFLESAGDGTLKVFSAGVKLAQALEAVDASSAPKMIRVEVV